TSDHVDIPLSDMCGVSASLDTASLNRHLLISLAEDGHRVSVSLCGGTMTTLSLLSVMVQDPSDPILSAPVIVPLGTAVLEDRNSASACHSGAKLHSASSTAPNVDGLICHPSLPLSLAILSDGTAVVAGPGAGLVRFQAPSVSPYAYGAGQSLGSVSFPAPTVRKGGVCVVSKGRPHGTGLEVALLLSSGGLAVFSLSLPASPSPYTALAAMIPGATMGEPQEAGVAAARVLAAIDMHHSDTDPLGTPSLSLSSALVSDAMTEGLQRDRAAVVQALVGMCRRATPGTPRDTFDNSTAQEIAAGVGSAGTDVLPPVLAPLLLALTDSPFDPSVSLPASLLSTQGDTPNGEDPWGSPSPADPNPRSILSLAAAYTHQSQTCVVPSAPPTLSSLTLDNLDPSSLAQALGALTGTAAVRAAAVLDATAAARSQARVQTSLFGWPLRWGFRALLGLPWRRALPRIVSDTLHSAQALVRLMTEVEERDKGGDGTVSIHWEDISSLHSECLSLHYRLMCVAQRTGLSALYAAARDSVESAGAVDIDVELQEALTHFRRSALPDRVASAFDQVD
ncbi:hypothetical protein KIPB_008855, partial [Kipferlia bialata]